MSLPRDLKVQIPGHGTDKINAAYELGGPRLTLRTVKQLTGLSINHVINVTFGGFWRAVNAIGCVYADIDRRYFNDNAGVRATINVQPGYQRLCGRKALQYVRFRHEDNDLVRSARQQDFLRQAKQQVNYTDLIKKRDQLVRDLRPQHHHRQEPALPVRGARLLKLAVFSAGEPIHEIHFEGLIGPELRRGERRARQEARPGVPQRHGHARARAGSSKKDRPHGGRSASGVPASARSGSRTPPASAATRRSRPSSRAPGRPCRCSSRRLRTTGSLYAGPPRVYKIRANGQELRRLPHGPEARPGGRVLRRPGHHLEGPADPRATPARSGRSAAASTSSTTTATVCGSWPGAPTRRPTGSRTPCSRPCPRAR